MFKLKLHEDTGWISIGKYSMYRKVNGIVYVNFQETPPSVGDVVTIFTMPIGFRPSKNLYFSASENHTTPQFSVNIVAKTTGEISLIASKNTQFIGSFSFPTD